jgi:hypothetical protein
MSAERWSVEKAWNWYNRFDWITGCNFIPSTAVNQIEMWQAETFDRDTILRELTWAHNIGLNSVRVYLHDLVWEHDRDGYISRIDEFLDMASRLNISVLLTIFDDCWYPDPYPGKQPEPVPGLHNSRWVQSPGMRKVKDKDSWPKLEEYVKDIVSEFRTDSRIFMWDIYNEVGNNFLPSLSKPQPVKTFSLAGIMLKRLFFANSSIPLLKKTFEWARSCAPEQPLTSSIWFPDRALNNYLLSESDIITFHNYKNQANLERQIDKLKSAGRPIVCTEYMARTDSSLFETHLPVFKKYNVGCYSWGLVAGKTQTHFSWKSKAGSGEPELWFHDIMRSDGSPFRQEEVDAICSIIRGEP